MTEEMRQATLDRLEAECELLVAPLPEGELTGVHARPDPEWVRGRCPRCGEEVVSNCYYIDRKGYVIFWECWESLGDTPSCTYRRLL